MRIIEDTKLGFEDVLFVPHRSSLISRSQVDLTRDYKFKHSDIVVNATGIVAANMDNIGTMQMAGRLTSNKMGCALTKHYSVDQLVEFFGSMSKDQLVFYSMGIGDEDLEKFQAVNRKVYIPYVNIDVANGYTERFVSFVRMFRDIYGDPSIQHRVIMAGTVVTPDITEQLILAGADIVRVGIGGGALCLTRRQTGVGYPQLSAVIECADAAHGLGGFICSDGGCTSPGDVAKAFGGGADFVMLGSMLAGHDEGIEEGITTYTDDQILVYGMSSAAAMKKHSGGVNAYRSSEGREVWIPRRGSVDNTILDLLGGLRSTCTYIGAKSLKEIPKRATFCKVMNGRQLNTFMQK